MAEKLTQTFNTWTEYDDWLIQNYNDYEIVNLNENENKTVTVEYEKKEEKK